MSQNIEDRRKKWPLEKDKFVVGSKEVDNKKVWEPPSDYNSKYTKNQVWTFRSGHAVEVDNTEGAERIRVSHANGSYVEMQHNGDVILRSEKDNFEVIQGGKNLRVKGNINIQVDGDANIKIAGSADVEIGGSATTTIGGLWHCKAEGIKFDTPFFFVYGDKMAHNDINIGYDSRHKDVQTGGDISGTPLPI